MSFNYSKWKNENSDTYDDSEYVSNTSNGGSATSTSSVKPLSGGFDYSAYKTKKASNTSNSTSNTTSSTSTTDVEPTTNSKVIYKNDKEGYTVTEDDLNKWVDPSYKLTYSDKKKAKATKKANYNYKTVDSLSDEEAQKYVTLDNKLRGVGVSFGSGFTKGAVPFVDTITKGISNLVLGDDADDFLEQLDTKKDIENQHKIANTTGRALGTALAYNNVQKIPVVGKVSDKIGNALGGSKLAKSVGNITADTLVDLGLDTIPELLDNVNEGMSGEEVAKEALKNVGTNIAFNVGGEVIGNVLDNISKNKDSKVARDVVENTTKKIQTDNIAKQTDEVNPVLETLKERSKDYTDMGTVLEKDLGKDVNLNSFSTSDSLAKHGYDEKVAEAYKESPQIYNVLHNADTKEQANAIIEACGDNNIELYSQFKQLLAEKKPTATILGDVLSKRYLAEGDIERGTEIIEALAKSMTEAGQFSQSAVITMTKDNPLAAMRMMQKNIDKINEAGSKKFKKWTNFELTSAEKEAFANIKPGDENAIKNLYEQITDRIGDTYPSTLWDKIVTTSKTTMMLNPRTHIRNVAANTAMLPVRSISDRVSALGQNVAKIFNPDLEVTQSLIGGTKEQKNVANQIFDEQIKPLLENNNRWDDVAKNVTHQRTYGDSKVGTALKDGTIKVSNAINTLTNGKMQKVVDGLDKNMTGSVLENLKRLDYWLLGAVEDDPFVKKNFSNRLASYMKAQGIKTVDDVPNDAIQLAYQEALKATFKDDNYLTKAFSNVKKSTGKFGEVMLPFTKTPANIAKRGIEYSPIGFVETLKTSKGKETQEIIDSLSKNAVGTIGIAIGFKLAENGMIQGALSSDKDEKQFEEQQGKKAFSLNVGGHYYTFDWAQPASIPLIIGSTIYDAVKESDDEINTLDLVKQAGVASFDAWADLSPLQSLAEIMGGNGYGNNSVGENVLNAVAEFPQRLYPAALNAIAKTNDPVVRDTYVKGDAVQTYKNTMQSKVPGLSEELPAKRDSWGREIKRQDSKASAFFANFINPGQLGYNASTPIDSEVQRVGAYPNVAERYISVSDGNGGSKNVALTNEQHSEYQKIMGEYSYQMAETLIGSKAYQNLNDNEKKEALSKVYSVAKSMAENKILGKEISNANKKYAEVYNTYGADGVVNYYDIKENASTDGNDSISQAELKAYLDGMNLSKEYKRYYWNLMLSKTDSKTGKVQKPKTQPY